LIAQPVAADLSRPTHRLEGRLVHGQVRRACLLNFSGDEAAVAGPAIPTA
jgi:hypothetical protein